MAETSVLIRHFLLGTTSPEDEAQLEALLEKEPQAGVDLLGQVQSAWEGASPSGLSPQQWAEADASVKAMARAEGRQSRFRISPRAAVFAAAMALLTAGGWFFGARMAGLLKKIHFSSASFSDKVKSSKDSVTQVRTVPTVQTVPTPEGAMVEADLPAANPDHVPLRATPPPEEFPTDSNLSPGTHDQTEPLPAH